MTALFSRFVFLVLLMSFASAANAQSQPLQDLRAAMASAKRQAEQSDTLDAAYELVGIADEAQIAKSPEIAKEATTTLIGVVERATQSALAAGVADAHDTLDQLVDLLFFARTSNVTGADAVMQNSLRALFPKITHDVQLVLATSNTSAERWPLALTNLSILGELQAAATLTMLDDLAAATENAFDSEAARLETLAQQVSTAPERDTFVGDIKAARSNRDEQVTDAKANNLATVAAEMNRSGRDEQRGQESSEASAGLVDANQTCTETGVIDQDGMYVNQEGIIRLEEECVLSGRIPTEDRCPIRELMFVCRDEVDPTMERITYTYRGTPEETTARERCKGEQLTVVQTAGRVPQFKNTAMRRVMSCVPIGGADQE